MKLLPQAFYNSKHITTLMADNQCGIIHKKTNKHSVDNHRLLSWHAITVVLKGALNIHSDDEIPLIVEADQMVLLPSGLYAITDKFAENEGFEAIVFFFNQEYLEDFLKSKPCSSIIESKYQRGPTKFDVTHAFSAFAAQTYSLYASIKADDSLASIKINEALNLLLLSKGNVALEHLCTLNSNPRRDLVSFMKAHYDKPLAVEDYATLSGRSVSTFRRAFHSQFGTSPKSWLIKHRLEKSKALLSNESLSIMNTAQLSGFNDVPHFIKSFQKRYNITPKQYALAQGE